MARLAFSSRRRPKRPRSRAQDRRRRRGRPQRLPRRPCRRTARGRRLRRQKPSIKAVPLPVRLRRSRRLRLKQGLLPTRQGEPTRLESQRRLHRRTRVPQPRPLIPRPRRRQAQAKRPSRRQAQMTGPSRRPRRQPHLPGRPGQRNPRRDRQGPVSGRLKTLTKTRRERMSLWFHFSDTPEEMPAWPTQMRSLNK